MQFPNRVRQKAQLREQASRPMQAERCRGAQHSAYWRARLDCIRPLVQGAGYVSR
ncbi:hypothetical protein Pla175_51730 [Pirellulimonas nuda]|uniref:Uncharacterized protein n=1 Tax=Pirellulimonas nuda TaxID=2528009 RepID=A0A518DJX2_9BACT|nr:hypothetical protein Pla175_51730 [Pirellulimonas nuda]